MTNIQRKLYDNGENLSWCKPYTTNDNRTKFAVNEGDLSRLIVDGKEIGHDEFGEYDLHELLDKSKECGCRDCPWFEECDAMKGE